MSNFDSSHFPKPLFNSNLVHDGLTSTKRHLTLNRPHETCPEHLHDHNEKTISHVYYNKLICRDKVTSLISVPGQRAFLLWGQLHSSEPADCIVFVVLTHKKDLLGEDNMEWMQTCEGLLEIELFLCHHHQ